MIRCSNCEKSIEWEESTDSLWTNISFDFDGLCYGCKRKLIPFFKERIRNECLKIIGG